MRADLSTRPPAIPLALKLAYSCFVAAHLWLNLRFYGPMNYLWFCDIAVLTTALALWMENRLLLCMTAISLFGPSTLWIVDVVFRLTAHRYLTGIADYMEDANLPMPIRLASTFHLWLPILLLFSIHRLGYDRRALIWQTAFAITVLILSRTLGAPPPAHDIHDVVNINCVYGTSALAPQTRLPAALYLCKVILKCWLGMYLPIHLILSWIFAPRRRAIAAAVSADSQSSTGQQPYLP